MIRIIFTALMASLVGGSAFCASVSLTLVPSSGTVTGAPGTVVGWGYDITNSDPTDWVVLNDSFVTGGLSTGTDGNYVDYLTSEFIVINPGSSTGSVSFSRGAPGAGTGEFDILALAPLTTITGAINVDYTVFSQDPNSPTFDPGSFVSAGTLSANAEVEVTSPVPEPGSVGLTGLALLPMVIAWWRRRKPQRS